MMARDFWSKALIQLQLRPMPRYSPVLAIPAKSSSVLETFWRRHSEPLGVSVGELWVQVEFPMGWRLSEEHP